MLERLDTYDRAVHDLLPGDLHWYLGILATRPDHAGQGLGRRTMAAGLLRARSVGVPAYLETTNPSNLDYYRKAGWHVVETVGVENVTVWVMLAGP